MEGLAYVPVVPTADTMRGLYQACYRLFCDQSYTAGMSSRGHSGRRRHVDTQWRTIADLVRTMNVDPLLYVAYAFQHYPERIVYPTYLQSNTWIRAFAELSRAAPAELAREWESGFGSIQHGAYLLQQQLAWEPGRSWRFAVADELTVQATTLVRLVVAMRQRHQDVVDYLFRTGLARYTLNRPVYDSVWQQIVPEQLQQCSNQMLAAFTHGRI